LPSRIRLRPRSTPPPPAEDSETLFLDIADGALKSIDSTGTVTTVGSGEGGAGGVNVNDTPVTNIVAAGATIDGPEATLASGGFAVQPDGSLQADLSEATLEGGAIDVLLPDDGRFFVKSTGAIEATNVEPSSTAFAFIVPDDQSSNRFLVGDEAGVEFIVRANGNISVIPNATATQIVQVFDSDANEVFRVSADGTVHIKTGGSIIADL